MELKKKKFIIPHYTEYTEKITKAARLCLVADLHSGYLDSRQLALIQAIEEHKPDAVLFSGDIVDERVPPAGAAALLEAVGRRYPCYYVTGNHEFKSGKVKAVKAMIRGYGVKVLAGNGGRLPGGEIQVFGVDDPYLLGNDRWRRQLDLCIALRDKDAYALLLSHRPERAEVYRSSGFDLVLCGHAHGGQVRLPGLINGLYAPKQGLFPRYAGGRYTLDQTVMIVSRGLCVNHIPRIFNPPELVMIDLIPR